MDYAGYLKLRELLALQAPESARQGRPAHDEMLFIIIHQTYELWFKQILTELDAVETVFAAREMDEADLARALAALERVLTIQKLLVDQVDILETMTPMDFLEFRNLLFPASGFQSAQFRLIETRLGLARDERLAYKATPFDQDLQPHERDQVHASETRPSLRSLLDQWLARMPFLSMGGFEFQKAYGQALNAMLAEDIARIESNEDLTAQEQARQADSLRKARGLLGSLLDADRFAKDRDQGAWTFSRDGLQAALFINLYRDEPILQVPFKILSVLMDIDEAMATWRYRHALMAYRMIGRKLGTGGSSGHDYLRQTAERHRVFADLFAIATFLIPRSHRPALPEVVRRAMHYVYRHEDRPASPAR